MTATAEPQERTTRVTTRDRHLLVAGAGLVILVLCGLVARDGAVGPAERRVFHAVNDLPGWLYRPLWVFQQFGNLFVAVGIGVAVCLLLRRYWVAGAVSKTPTHRGSIDVVNTDRKDCEQFVPTSSAFSTVRGY